MLVPFYSLNYFYVFSKLHIAILIMYSSTPVVVNLERTLLVLLMYLSLRTFPWQLYFILIIVICGLTPTLFNYCNDLGSISISY